MTTTPATARPPAPIGRRIAAHVLDQLPPLLGYVLLWVGLIGAVASGGAAAGGLVAAVLLLYPVAALGYAVFTWWYLATKGLSLGKRALGIQLVGEHDGQPIGWGRVLGRGLVLGLIGGLTLGIGLVVMAVVAAQDPRRRAWHDKAVGSVVVEGLRAPTHAAALPPAAAHRPAPVVPVRLPEGTAAPTRVEVPPPPSPLPAAAVAPPAATPPPVVTPPPVPPQAAPPPLAPAPSTSRLIAAVPGIVSDVPTAGAAPAPAAPVPAARLEHADLPDDVEHTRMAPLRRPGTGVWALDVGAGRTVQVTGTGLLGRDPEARDGEAVDHLVAVDDPSRSVSKTHLAFGVDVDGLWVVDRRSTNGTAVEAPDGSVTECQAGERVRVRAGGAVLVGDHRIPVSCS